MLSTQKGGFRERNLARDGRVALTVLGEDWYDHASLRGRVVEMRADPDWVDLDALSQHYWGVPYPRDAGYYPSTVIVEVDAWHEFHSQGRAKVRGDRSRSTLGCRDSARPQRTGDEGNADPEKRKLLTILNAMLRDRRRWQCA